MTRFLFGLFLLGILNTTAPTSFAAANEGAKMRPWFTNASCTGLAIRRTKSATRDLPTHAFKFDDAEAATRMMKRIEKISPDGDMMKSMLIDEEIHLTFKCGTTETVVQIYDGRFKTPTTGFNSGGKDKTLESALYKDLQALLEPSIDKNIFKFQNHELAFPGFTIAFSGTDIREQKPGEPTIGRISTERYSVKDKAGKEQVLSVSSGQLPPQPLDFEVNGEKLTLLTFEDSRKERIYPDYFRIIARK